VGRPCSAALVLPRLQGHLHLDKPSSAARHPGERNLPLVALVIWPTPLGSSSSAPRHRRVVGVVDRRLRSSPQRQVTPRVGADPFAVGSTTSWLQGPFVLGGLGFGVVDTFLPIRETLLIAAFATRAGHSPHPPFPLAGRGSPRSLQLVTSPSLTIGEHVILKTARFWILIEYRVDTEEVDDFLCTMASFAL